MGGVPVSDEGPQSFGTVLTKLRRAAGLTQEELAERAGLSARGIGNLERGVRRPRRFTVQLLVDGLALTELDRDELLAASRRAHQTEPSEPVVPCQHLVGRGAERALIDAHLAATDSPMLLLTGQTGIGKTRLLAEAARIAQARRMTVLSGACQRFGGEPYTPVVDALAGYVRAVSPLALRRHLNDCAGLEWLLPELAGELESGPSRTRRLMFAAAVRFVSSLAGRHGVLLVLDDLQWAGADGLTLLASLVRAVRPDRVRILAAYRDTEVPPSSPLAEAVLDLARQQLVTHCPLSPLAAPDDATLLRHSAGLDVRDDVRERVLRLAGGLPLFLVQLGHALGGAGDALPELPWGLTHAVRQQIGALPTTTVEVLTLLAVSQRRLDADALATAAGLDPDDLPDMLAPAHAAWLLDETADGVRLTHELVAEVINADLNPSHRHLLHRRLADADSGRSGAAAYHYTHAQDSERAAQTLRHAAEQAARQAAHDTAARYLGDLVDLLDRTGSQAAVAEAAEEWSGELAAAGRYDAALAAAERALLVYRKEGDEERQRLVIARIGYLHYQRGTPREGLARIATAEPPESGSAVQLHLARAANLYQSTRYQDAVEVCTAAIAAATATGDERGIAGGHLRRGLAARLLGDNRAALADLHAAASAAELCGDRNTVVRALTGIAVLHHYRGELSRADRQFTRILQLAEELGDREVLSRAVCNVGASAVYLGHWRQALRRFDQALDLAGADSSPMCASMALIGRGSLLSACGRHDEARADLLKVVQLGTDSDNIDLVRNATAQLVETDVRLGHPARGVARLMPLLDRPGRHEWQVTDALPFLAEAQLAVGDAQAARRIAADAAKRAQDIEHAIARTDALRVHGMAAAELGQTSVATANMHEALSLAHLTGSPYLEARVRSAWATVARWRDDHDHAAREQALADDLFTALSREVSA